MLGSEASATATGALPRSSATAVRLAGIRRRFGTVIAADGVDLEIAEGEFFTMLGPSGSGKTTLLRMIAGFERPDAGTIELGGVDVTRDPPYLRNVNTVFQDYALFPHMTVLAERRVRDAGPQGRRAPSGGSRAERALDMVRLSGLGDRKPVQLSGGQRQRVALARAIVNEPEVLLLDEPLGALDLKLRQEMQTELKRIQREVGITFVYVTHDQEEALTMSDRLAVHEPRPHRAARHADRRLRAARRPSSWPASSACRTCSSATAAGSPSGPRRCASSSPATRRPPGAHVEAGADHRGRSTSAWSRGTSSRSTVAASSSPCARTSRPRPPTRSTRSGRRVRVAWRNDQAYEISGEIHRPEKE